MDLRRLAVTDLAAGRALSEEAFGGWPAGQQQPPLPTELPAGRREWGAFDGERLAAKVAALDHHTWLGGREVASCGIAGVAVAAEDRGRGLLAPLLAALVEDAVGRGQVVSTLYPTAPGIYRSAGWEVVSSLDTVALPTAELARVRTPEGARTRRAGADDVDAVHAVYSAWASAQQGPLTRTGPHFPRADRLAERDGCALALDAAGDVVGYVSWTRGHGYGAAAVLRVHDLLATTGDGYRTLWSLLGTWASVTGTIRLTTSGFDPARLALPAMSWDVVDRHPYMARVLDLPGFVAALAPSLPGGGEAEVPLEVTGDRLGLVDGGFVLRAGAGGASCAPGPVAPGAASLTVHGLGLLALGALDCANLRLLGHLTGGSPAHDRLLDALLPTRPLHVRDYF